MGRCTLQKTNLTKTVDSKNQQIVILAEDLRSNASAVTYLRKSFKEEESLKRGLQANLGNKTKEMMGSFLPQNCFLDSPPE
jgi:hypothetical protein